MDSDSAHSNDGRTTTNGRPKRRRVALACRPCRERKSRCDGVHPVCSTCEQSGTVCSFPPALSKHDILKQEVIAMFSNVSERMAKIEERLSLVANTPAQSMQSNMTIPQTDHGDAQKTPRSDTGGIVIMESAFQDSLPSAEAVDGSAIVPLTPGDNCAFFGPSSNIAFLSLVSRVLEQDGQTYREAVPGQPDSSSGTGLDNTLSNFPIEAPLRAFPLPSDETARALIDAYFVSLSPIHPYIHRGSFMDTYEEVRRSGFKRVRRVWLALLYLVFACGALGWPYHDNGAPLVDRSEPDKWYKLGSDLTLQMVFSNNGNNPELVQCLLTMVMYLQGTLSSMKTWVIHGLAVRLAYQLGLHSAEVSKRCDAVKAEMLRRTWFCIVALDRTLSVSFGRPAQIQYMHEGLPLPKPYEDSTRRGCFPEDEMAASFMCSTIELYEIAHRTVVILYDANYGARPVFTLDSVAKAYAIEADLIKWVTTRPESHAILATDPSGLDCSPVTDPVATQIPKQRNVLTLRYLHVRILIHRPALEGLLETMMRTNDLDHNYVRTMKNASSNSITTIISCAVRMIKTIHHLICITPEGFKWLGAWWFSLYYAFNSALAILGCLYVCYPVDQSTILGKNEVDMAAQALHLCLEILTTLGPEQDTVSRCKGYIEKLIHVASPFVVRERAAIMPQHNSSIPAATTGTNGVYASAPYQTAGESVSQLPNPGEAPLYGPQSYRQMTADMDMESFLFPLDMQMYGGQFADLAQPPLI